MINFLNRVFKEKSFPSTSTAINLRNYAKQNFAINLRERNKQPVVGAALYKSNLLLLHSCLFTSVSGSVKIYLL